MPEVARKTAKINLDTLAERRLKALLTRARRIPTLRRFAPAPRWEADVSLVGPKRMQALNFRYRGMNYATDVLSFEASREFRVHGFIGYLLICTSVLKRQAREHGHAAELELEILLVHGLLHLLGFDHEKGARAAAEMRRWETRLLGRAARRGLISRAGDGRRLGPGPVSKK